MKTIVSVTLVTILLLGQQALSLDPFYPPDEWNRYTSEIIRNQSHEQGHIRPKAGESPIVGLHTLILGRLEVKNSSVFAAIDQWKQLCATQGVKVSVYVDPTVVRNQDSLTLDIKDKTAIECLRIICSQTLSALSIELSGDHILVGFGGELKTHRTSFQSWILDESVARSLGLATGGGGNWKGVEGSLTKKGATFPEGSYADYRDDIRALIVINHPVTIESFGKLISELQQQSAIEATKDSGETQMEGYSLETQSFPLAEAAVTVMHGHLFDGRGKLVPFASSTRDILESIGVIAPAGSAAWLDWKAKTLWLRNRPDILAGVTKQLALLEIIEPHATQTRIEKDSDKTR